MSNGFFRTHDGLKLYYERHGQGPALVCCNGIGVSTFFWRYIRDYFQDRCSVVLWDYRGHNRSESPTDLTALTMSDNVKDLLALLDHLDLPQAVLLGHSMGVQVILECSRQAPDRCRALVPMLGTYGTPMKTFFGNDLIERFFPVLFPLGSRVDSRPLLRPLMNTTLLYHGARLTSMINPQYCPREDMEPYFDHLRRMDPRIFLHMAKFMNSHTSFSHLSQITQPTLIVAAEKDYFTPLYLSRKMHKLIRGSELLVIRKGSHAALVEHPELINLRLDKFLREKVGLC